MARSTTGSETARIRNLLAGGHAERVALRRYQDLSRNRGSFPYQPALLTYLTWNDGAADRRHSYS